MAQVAVLRNFEIIGEAAKRLPRELIEKHSEIPWSGMARFRDVLIHQYDSIDLDEVWATIENNVPELTLSIGSIALPKGTSEGDEFE